MYTGLKTHGNMNNSLMPSYVSGLSYHAGHVRGHSISGNHVMENSTCDGHVTENSISGAQVTENSISSDHVINYAISDNQVKDKFARLLPNHLLDISDRNITSMSIIQHTSNRKVNKTGFLYETLKNSSTPEFDHSEQTMDLSCPKRRRFSDTSVDRDDSHGISNDSQKVGFCDRSNQFIRHKSHA